VSTVNIASLCRVTFRIVFGHRWIARVVMRSKGNRDVKSRSTIPVKKMSIEQVDSEKFEEAAAKRLGLY
jgi:hypothetical protein